MVRPSFMERREPELRDILDALDDEDCRSMIRALDSPMTASELSETCDVPLSTAYRKLNLLTEASLLEEQTEVRRDGHHTKRYRIAFEEVNIALDENRDLAVAVVRPAAAPDEQLADLWHEVRRET